MARSRPAASCSATNAYRLIARLTRSVLDRPVSACAHLADHTLPEPAVLRVKTRNLRITEDESAIDWLVRGWQLAWLGTVHAQRFISYSSVGRSIGCISATALRCSIDMYMCRELHPPPRAMTYLKSWAFMGDRRWNLPVSATRNPAGRRRAPDYATSSPKRRRVRVKPGMHASSRSWSRG
jgi:hypothetical protein